MNICDTCGTAYQVNESFDKHNCKRDDLDKAEKIADAWDKWVKIQQGDWRDVSHMDSFWAGFEAADVAVLLDQYRKALISFGVQFADNGFIRKIPRQGIVGDEFDAKGDAWDEFLNRKNPAEHSDSYAGFQFGWNAAIAYMKGEKYQQIHPPTASEPDLCKCAVRNYKVGLAICQRCQKPYNADGRFSGGRYA